MIQRGQTSRRAFLTAGASGLCGLTLADLLRAESTSNKPSRSRSLINIHLDGGPPHLDMIDLKTDAPVEIRGEFFPIATQLPGFEICELMPRLALQADRMVFVRSLVQSAGAHDGFQCQSGYSEKDLKSLGGRPALGSVVSRLQGRADDPAPQFVDLMQGRALVRNSARPGFLGPAFQPFRPDISALFQRELEAGMKNELKRLGDQHATSLTLHDSLTAARLQTRTGLRSQFDRLRHSVDASGMMDAMDSFSQQAVSILTAGRFADAMDLSREDPRTLARYALPAASDERAFYTADGPDATRKFLLARRLIEAGVRCVNISLSDFDTHSSNFPRMRQLLPVLDHGLATLMTDLEERGMADDVVIVAWGEFGRTPRVDPKTGGRHHWPQVGPAIIAGGGLRTGQVIGSTDRTGSTVTSRPVTYKDMLATVYSSLGIDARQTTLIDPQGRPQYVLDEGTPLAELV